MDRQTEPGLQNVFHKGSHSHCHYLHHNQHPAYGYSPNIFVANSVPGNKLHGGESEHGREHQRLQVECGLLCSKKALTVTDGNVNWCPVTSAILE